MEIPSGFLHSPIRNSPFPIPSSPSSFFHRPCSLISCRNECIQRDHNSISVCLHQENHDRRGSYSCANRVILLIGGIAAVPNPKKIRAHTGESFEPSEDNELERQVGGELVEGSLANIHFELIPAIGLMVFLVALNASTGKEKARSDGSDATMELMNSEPEEGDASVAVADTTKDQHSLVNELKFTDDTVIELKHELQSAERLIEELNIKANHLEGSLREVVDENGKLKERLNVKIQSVEAFRERLKLMFVDKMVREENLHQVTSELGEKETELNQLTSEYQESQDHITGLNDEIKQLKDGLRRTQMELLLKNKMVRKLRAQLASLCGKQHEFNRRHDCILKEYKFYKSCMVGMCASEAKVLRVKEDKIRLLEEQLQVSRDEGNKKWVLITDVVLGKVNLGEVLSSELKNVKDLRQELSITRDALEKSKADASDLAEQLQQSRELCLQLEAEVSEMQAKFREARESLQRNVDEANQDAEVLAGVIGITAEVLSKSNEILQNFEKMADAAQKCDGLEKELFDARGKEESLMLELKEEKKTVSVLNEELKLLQAKISLEEEARKRLESDLEEATKSLNEKNQKARMVRKDLVLSYMRASNREDENEALQKRLDEIR